MVSNTVGQRCISDVCWRARELLHGLNQRLNVPFSVHCSTHCFNLVIFDSVKAVSEVACVFCIASTIVCTVSTSGSYVHEKFYFNAVLTLKAHTQADCLWCIVRL